MFHNCSISYCVTFVGSGGIKELRNPLVASMLHFGGSLGDSNSMISAFC